MIENLAISDTGAQLVQKFNFNFSQVDVPFFNIKSYGATGDGITNDTEAIQGAIDACIAAGGGTVYIPIGIYITNTLDFNATVRIIGDGAGSVLKSIAAEVLLRCVNSVEGEYQFYLNLENIFLEGDNIGTHGFVVNRNLRFKISNVQIQNFTQYGILGEGLLIGSLNNVFISNCVIGFSNKLSTETPSLAPNHIIFINCIFINNTSWAIDWNYGLMVYFSYCNFEFNGTIGESTTGAIRFTTAYGNSTTYGHGLHFDGCWFEYNYGTIISIENSHATRAIMSSINNTMLMLSDEVVSVHIISGGGINKLSINDSSIGDSNSLLMDGANSLIINNGSIIYGTVTQNDGSKYYTVDVTEVT